MSETEIRFYDPWEGKKGESKTKIINFQKAHFNELSELLFKVTWEESLMKKKLQRAATGQIGRVNKTKSWQLY